MSRRGGGSSIGIGYLITVIGAAGAVFTLLKLLAITLEGFTVAMTGGSASAIEPYIVGVVLLMVSASIPDVLAPFLPDGAFS